MIICFSGTGNSKRVALHLQELLGDDLVRLAPGQMVNPKSVRLPITDGRVIWVFPVFSWGLPRITEEVLKHARIVSATPITHHLVVTCGDDVGYVDRLWRSYIEAKGKNHKVGSAFSVQMPNIYTFMRGFDVDKPEVAKAKLDLEPERTAHIAELIEDSDTPIVDLTRGKFAWFKTYVIRPWFKRFKWSTKPFHTNGRCNGCGRCMRNCPVNGIELIEGRPHWNGTCTMCLRCYHCCPRHAIEYGKATQGKGQYLCPGYELK